MKMFNRIGKFGHAYHIRQNVFDPETTIIRTKNKEISVKHHIDKIEQSWYDWQQKGQFIQDAFSYLSDDEREFILTGMTVEQWNEMMKDEESF